MFAGGPGIFIHQAAGVPEGVWGSTDAEVAFALDGPTAVRLGGGARRRISPSHKRDDSWSPGLWHCDRQGFAAVSVRGSSTGALSEEARECLPRAILERRAL